MQPGRRAPLGARGLKFEENELAGENLMSRSARSAWIEIEIQKNKRYMAESRSARSAWIEITYKSAAKAAEKSSRSARSAWIEIPLTLCRCL